MATVYEWDIEEMDTSDPTGEDHDIIDHNHSDTLQGFGNFLSAVDGNNFCLALVRDVGDEYEGLEERSWAYVELTESGWELPEHFDNGSRVPKRFHQEFERCRDQMMMP